MPLFSPLRIGAYLLGRRKREKAIFYPISGKTVDNCCGI
jgi:hypothetical protein